MKSVNSYKTLRYLKQWERTSFFARGRKKNNEGENEKSFSRMGKGIFFRFLKFLLSTFILMRLLLLKLSTTTLYFKVSNNLNNNLVSFVLSSQILFNFLQCLTIFFVNIDVREHIKTKNNSKDH